MKVFLTQFLSNSIFFLLLDYSIQAALNNVSVALADEPDNTILLTLRSLCYLGLEKWQVIAHNSRSVQ